MMKRTLLILSALSLAFAAGCSATKGAVRPAADNAAAAAPAAPAADNGAAKPAEEAKQDALTPEKIGKYSYAVGIDIGRNFKREDVPLDVERLAKGLRDAMAVDGAKEEFTDNEVTESLRDLKKELNDRQAKKVHEMMRKNRADGQAYLDANEKKEGVKKTASGLQYRSITEGTGKAPKATDTVTVHYTGTLIDGKKFDSSYDRKEPATFPLNGVIPGWTEGLQLMKEGGKAQLCIPSHLAYGENGAGNVIPPNSTLLFDVELLTVKGADEPAAAAPAEAPKDEKK